MKRHVGDVAEAVARIGLGICARQLRRYRDLDADRGLDRMELREVGYIVGLAIDVMKVDNAPPPAELLRMINNDPAGRAELLTETERRARERQH